MGAEGTNQALMGDGYFTKFFWTILRTFCLDFRMFTLRMCFESSLAAAGEVTLGARQAVSIWMCSVVVLLQGYFGAETCIALVAMVGKITSVAAQVVAVDVVEVICSVITK